jgi:DNA-binding transcriptional ArsR family regulator
LDVTIRFPIFDSIYNHITMKRDVFQAIADPTRRKIISLLVRQNLTLNEVAKNFKISRPAISKHIKILVTCGVVKIRPEGRQRICIAQLNQLKKIYDWVNQYQLFWNNQ